MIILGGSGGQGYLVVGADGRVLSANGVQVRNASGTLVTPTEGSPGPAVRRPHRRRRHHPWRAGRHPDAGRRPDQEPGLRPAGQQPGQPEQPVADLRVPQLAGRRHDHQPVAGRPLDRGHPGHRPGHRAQPARSPVRRRRRSRPGVQAVRHARVRRPPRRRRLVLRRHRAAQHDVAGPRDRRPDRQPDRPHPPRQPQRPDHGHRRRPDHHQPARRLRPEHDGRLGRQRRRPPRRRPRALPGVPDASTIRSAGSSIRASSSTPASTPTSACAASTGRTPSPVRSRPRPPR